MSLPEENEEDVSGNPAPNTGSSASPNHPKNQNKVRPVSYERAKQRLIQRYGYKEDELDTLFKQEEDLVEFYHKTVKGGLNRKNKEAEDAIAWDKEDDFDLSPEEKARLAKDQSAKAIKEYSERDQTVYRKDARVAPEELDEVRRTLKELLEEEI